MRAPFRGSRMTDATTIITYCGKPIDDLTREEAIAALKHQARAELDRLERDRKAGEASVAEMYRLAESAKRRIG